MAQEWTFNEKQIKTDKVEKYWQAGSVITITLVSGDSEACDFGTTDKADKALKVMKNLSIIDDIDGI